MLSHRNGGATLSRHTPASPLADGDPKLIERLDSAIARGWSGDPSRNMHRALRAKISNRPRQCDSPSSQRSRGGERPHKVSGLAILACTAEASTADSVSGRGTAGEPGVDGLRVLPVVAVS